MGINLSIRQTSEIKIDKQGHNTWVVTELANLKNCTEIVNSLSYVVSDSIVNDSTITISSVKFYEILEDLKEDKKSAQDTLNSVKYNKFRIESLENRIIRLDKNIELLQDFIKNNNIPNDDSEWYEVNASW